MLKHTLKSEKKPKRVVVLGACGFVSLCLQDHLKQAGVTVKAVSSKEVDLAADGTDKKLAEALKSDDALVITSALTPDKGRDEATLMKNLRMAENVCATLKKKPCAHVVYISSDAVYKGEDLPLTENSCREPVDLYGLMHTTREMMLGSVLKGIPFCIVRPCAVYGAGDTHNSYGPNRFAKMVVKDRKVAYFGGGEEQRDHLFVEDAAGLLMGCLMRRSVGVLNLATGKAVPFSEVAELIIKTCPFEVAVESKPRAAGAVITHRPFDNSALMKAFPDFKFTPLEKGIGDMMAKLLKSDV